MIVVPVVLSLQMVALAIQYRGMVPFPTPIYIAVMVFYGLCVTLPYWGDRLLSQRLPVFVGTLVFSPLLTSIEYLLSLGPFGSWFAPPYSQYGNLPLLQLLSMTGLWGITFLIGWSAPARNPLWEEWTTSRRVPIAAVAVRAGSYRGDTGRRCPACALPPQRPNRAGCNALKDGKAIASRSKGCGPFLSA